MKAKKLIVFVLLAILLLSTFGCGGGAEEEEVVSTPTPTPTPTATPMPTPRFELTPLTISPAQALSGQHVIISTTVRNLGSGAGTYSAELEINESVVDTKDVMVSAGGSAVVTFSVSRDEPGTYDVKLGSRRGSFEVKHPPLNVTLDYVGVKYDHDPSDPGEIYLIVLVDDGEQTDPYHMEIPLPGTGGLEISDYETKRVDERLFHTSSVGDYLEIVVLAYDYREPSPLEGLWGRIGGIVGGLVGYPTLGAILGEIIDAMDSQAPEFEYVGSYQDSWRYDESWGIDQYDEVGDDDLRLWFRIWSDLPQQLVTQPRLLPDVAIQNVDMPSEVRTGEKTLFGWRNGVINTITLRNNEAHPIPVYVGQHSSVTGSTEGQSVTVPANGTLNVEFKVVYYPSGVRTMTYTLFYKDEEIESWSGEVVATP